MKEKPSAISYQPYAYAQTSYSAISYQPKAVSYWRLAVSKSRCQNSEAFTLSTLHFLRALPESPDAR
jgi:hypothetical protein